MSQFVHLLTYFGTTIPADLWVPSKQDIPPQQAQQISTGIFKYLEKLHLEIGIEAYYKKMEQLIEYKQGYNLFGTNEWENALEKNGKGYSKGIEFLIQKKTGKFNRWLS